MKRFNLNADESVIVVDVCKVKDSEVCAVRDYLIDAIERKGFAIALRSDNNFTNVVETFGEELSQMVDVYCNEGSYLQGQIQQKEGLSLIEHVGMINSAKNVTYIGNDIAFIGDIRRNHKGTSVVATTGSRDLMYKVKTLCE